VVLYYTDLLPELPPVEQLEFGTLVGVVEVVDCVPLTEVEDDPFAVGPWCWLLARPRRVQPVPFKGQVALFDVPDHLTVPLRRRRNAQAPSHESRLN
jgi:hypothetical protein